MNLKLGLVVVSAVALSACGKFRSNDARSGARIFGKAEAITVMTRAPLFCQTVSEMKDGSITTLKFNADMTGAIATFSTVENKMGAKDAMTWDIVNDVLTMSAPTHNPNVMVNRIRFSGKPHAETITMISPANKVTYFAVCEI